MRMTTFSPYTVGEGGDTQVDLLLAEEQGDPTILWDASFGDVHVRHDLQATDHTGVDLAGSAR